MNPDGIFCRSSRGDARPVRLRHGAIEKFALQTDIPVFGITTSAISCWRWRAVAKTIKDENLVTTVVTTR